MPEPLASARGLATNPLERKPDTYPYLSSLPSIVFRGSHVTPNAPSDAVIIVSGLPRSGTSMMMQMLEAGGIEILSDGERAADDDNPKGYYELEAVKKTKEDASWLEAAAGKAVKMISQLLLDLPADRDYQVIFMRRDLREILASQQKMLDRRGGGESADIDDAQMEALFAKHLEQTIDWIESQPNMKMVEVWHAQTVTEPDVVAAQVTDFLERDMNQDRMTAVVDGGLHRNRGTEARS